MASPFFSEPGVALATFLHTFGAIGYMGGVAFFVGWARSLQRGHDNPAVLATGASLTYVSILMNLLGGFLRTYQPGHPGFEQFGSSDWVTLMVVKHAALFAGMGAAVYLFELHAPRLRRVGAQGLAPRAARTARVMLTTVVTSIVVAAVLGGVSTVLDLGGEPTQETLTIPERPEPTVHQREGTLSGTQPETGRFDVPEAASRIRAVFVAQPAGPLEANEYTLALRDPTGATTQETTQGQPTDARRIELEIPTPAAGGWEYTVTSTAAVAVQYNLEIEVVPSTVFEGSIDLAAGESFEINIAVEQDVPIAWDWSATGHVAWNIHTHAGGAQTVVEGHTEGDAGVHSTQAAGIYSYMWTPDQDVRLTFRVWGDYEILSVS